VEWVAADTRYRKTEAHFQCSMWVTDVSSISISHKDVNYNDVK
jgi:hypothetical protein